MSEVLSDGDEGSRVFSLKPHSYDVEHVTKLLLHSQMAECKSNHVARDEFSCQIIQKKTHDKILDARATDTLYHDDVSRVTPLVVEKKC